jgi:hypothetical protein
MRLREPASFPRCCARIPWSGLRADMLSNLVNQGCRFTFVMLVRGQLVANFAFKPDRKFYIFTLPHRLNLVMSMAIIISIPLPTTRSSSFEMFSP